MTSSHAGLTRRSTDGRAARLLGLAVFGMLAATGCQVEYAGVTMPSGKYMQDDVQYFAPGPEFPYANTQAATQRARLQASGIPVPPAPGAPGTGMGAAGQGVGINGLGVPVAQPLGGGAIARPTAAPEAENSMPGGPSAPNMSIPNTPPSGAPGGAMPAPPQ